MPQQIGVEQIKALFPGAIVTTDADGIITVDTDLNWGSQFHELVIGRIQNWRLHYPNAIEQFGSDGNSPAHVMYSYGSTAVAPFIRGVATEGSMDSPLPVTENHVLFRLRGSGYDGGTPSESITRAEVRLLADEDFSATNHGSRIELWATPNGEGGSLSLIATFHNNGSIDLPEGGTYNIDGAPHTHENTYVSESLFGIIDNINTEFFTTRIFQGGTTLVTINGLEQLLDTDYFEIPLEKKIIFSDPPRNVGFTDAVHIRYFAA